MAEKDNAAPTAAEREQLALQLEGEGHVLWSLIEKAEAAQAQAEAALARARGLRHEAEAAGLLARLRTGGLFTPPAYPWQPGTNAHPLPTTAPWPPRA